MWMVARAAMAHSKLQCCFNAALARSQTTSVGCTFLVFNFLKTTTGDFQHRPQVTSITIANEHSRIGLSSRPNDGSATREVKMRNWSLAIATSALLTFDRADQLVTESLARMIELMTVRKVTARLEGEVAALRSPPKRRRWWRRAG